MAKLETMSLPELYARPRITASVEKVIMMKQDFSQMVPEWCEKVCKLKCKAPKPLLLKLEKKQVDILIIQDYKAFDDDKYNKQGRFLEETNKRIIEAIASEAFRKKRNSDAVISWVLTDMVKCDLKKQDTVGGKAPADTIISKCRPYLLEEIKQRKPKVIISLNTSVTKALGLKKTNYGNRGEIFENTVFTLHPRTLLMLRQNSSGKFWGPDFYEIIKRDFIKAADIVRGRLRNPVLTEAVEKYRRNVHVARSIDDVVEFTNELTLAGTGSILSFDTETNTLDPFGENAKIITMQFGYRTNEGYIKALVFPMWHRENSFYDPDQAWPYIRAILENPRIAKLGHNFKFDYLMVAAVTGCRIVGDIHDTMLYLHAKDSGTQGNLGLKQAVWDYLPETELGGYEDLLPPLSTAKEIEKYGESDEEEVVEGETDNG